MCAHATGERPMSSCLPAGPASRPDTSSLRDYAFAICGLPCTSFKELWKSVLSIRP
jgi:hypothetical protein